MIRRAGQRVRQFQIAISDRNTALLLGAGFVSEIGDWFNTVALISLSYQFGDGALSVGGMLALRMLPRLIVQGPAGSLVDRHAGRGLLFATQLVMAVFASAFILLTAVPSLWLLYLLVLLLDTANTVAKPAFMVQLRNEAPAVNRAAANGLLFASWTTAQLIGPVLGAALLVPFGPGVVFLANGLTFLAVAVAILGLRSEPAAPAADGAPEDAADHDGAAAVGYRWLLRQGELRAYALMSLSLALLVQATIALFVVRANTLGLGDVGVGVFYTAVAAGSLIGSIVAGATGEVGRAALVRVAVAGGVCAVALASYGVVGALGVAIVALAIAGFTTDYHEVAALTYFQHRLPDAVYGRFFSLVVIVLSAGGLVGALLGPLAERFASVGGSLTILALPGLASALVLATVARRDRGHRQLPSGEGDRT